MVGQEHVARILRNALRSGRVGHAYLLVGPRGVGKTTTARIFAKALNCSGRPEDDVEPCGACPSCRDITAGVDLDVVELDAASNNHVEDVRTLREQVGYATVRAPNRIWIVDEVHMLSLPAFNAFLKTLEEPPESVKFIFCTTEEHKLPDTFKSRCQRVEFRPITTELMAERLCGLAAKEGIDLDAQVAHSIASGAAGGLRDAESLLEQLMAACPDGAISLADLDALAGRAPAELLETLLHAVDGGDASAALDAVDACIGAGCKPGVLMDQWLELLRAQMVGAARAAVSGDSSGEDANAAPSVARIARAIDVLLAKRAHLRGGADGNLIAQVTAIELARLPDARDLDALISALSGAAPVAPVSGGRASGDRVSGGRVSGGRVSGGRVSGGLAPSASTPPKAATSRAATPRAATPKAATPKSPQGRSGPTGSSSAGSSPSSSSSGSSTSGSSPVGQAPQSAPRAGATPRPGQAPSGGAVQTAKLDVSAVRTDWKTFLAAATRRDTRLGALLERLDIRDVKRGVLTLDMPVEIDGARATFARREVQIAFSQVAREVFGEALRPRLRVSSTAAEVAPEEEAMRDHPVVNQVAEATHGRVLNVRRLAVEDAASSSTNSPARDVSPARSVRSADGPEA